MLKFIFSIPFFIFAVVLGVSLWFLIDYLEQFRLHSSVADIGTIFAMATVFGIVFYLAVAIFAIPARKIFCKQG